MFVSTVGPTNSDCIGGIIEIENPNEWEATDFVERRQQGWLVRFVSYLSYGSRSLFDCCTSSWLIRFLCLMSTWYLLVSLICVDGPFLVSSYGARLQLFVQLVGQWLLQHCKLWFCFSFFFAIHVEKKALYQKFHVSLIFVAGSSLSSWYRDVPYHMVCV